MLQALDVLNITMKSKAAGDKTRMEYASMWLDRYLGRTRTASDETADLELFGDVDLLDESAKLWLLERALLPETPGSDMRRIAEDAGLSVHELQPEGHPSSSGFLAVGHGVVVHVLDNGENWIIYRQVLGLPLNQMAAGWGSDRLSAALDAALASVAEQAA